MYVRGQHHRALIVTPPHIRIKLFLFKGQGCLFINGGSAVNSNLRLTVKRPGVEREMRQYGRDGWFEFRENEVGWCVPEGDSTNKFIRQPRIIVDAASAERCRFPVRKIIAWLTWRLQLCIRFVYIGLRWRRLGCRVVGWTEWVWWRMMSSDNKTTTKDKQYIKGFEGTTDDRNGTMAERRGHALGLNHLKWRNLEWEK